jgi:hypothetical protein
MAVEATLMARDVGGDGFDLRGFEALPAREVPVGALSPGLCVRQGGTSAVHVQLLVDAAAGAALPAILVQEDGWRVIDGLHRLEGAKLRGEHIIEARFVDCTDSEALVLAMKANSSHGLPLSKADRVSGAGRVLIAHPDWSDRAIAGITGLSAKTIAALRNRSLSGVPAGKRLGRDGRRRPVTAGEGRLRAVEYLSAHPDAPLRLVARETDVSLGTVHDVSARLRRGVNPHRNGQRDPVEQPTTDPTTTSTGVGAAGNVTPLRRKNHTETPLTWAAIAAKVANDPSIRYTDAGKGFFRWMALHATQPEGWREFIDAIPAHWLSVITPIAASTGQEWTLFAERLKTKQDTTRWTPTTTSETPA